jgi:leucyl/phenylalanyl-tRNA--protein transferase
MIERMLSWITTGSEFPPVEFALRHPNGLLAAGDDLTPDRLIDAYRRGVFPWYAPGQPVLWWSPDPRMVLMVDDFRVRRSLAKVLRNGGFEIRIDTAFAEIVESCARVPRHGQDGTWITPEMVRAYCVLHARGHAHSVEAWRDGHLSGGLYGLALGRMFFGESMFARERDASKVALAHLVAVLRKYGFPMIDCQQETAHLASMGARPIARNRFAELVAVLVDSEPVGCPWSPLPFEEVLA